MGEKKPTIAVRELIDVIDNFAPFALAEAWDNVGIMVGNPEQKVTGILVALDPTPEILEEAQTKGLNVIVTHHPLIFHPLKSVIVGKPPGNFLAQALSLNIAVIGCHTNLDVIPGGVSDTLAHSLGLKDTRPLQPSKRVETGGAAPLCGFGRIGSYPEPLSPAQFFERLTDILDLSRARMAGIMPEKITTVAVCGGSGSDLAEVAFNQGAQIYLTAEVKHSVARWAEASGFCLLDGGHFATENQVVPILAAAIKKRVTARGIRVPVETTARQHDPFRFCH